ncbi:hypothetical protein LSUE1_G008361 [Lachnellula suecica]|uniref:BTB domain-containing protein n=1 Tax=Lachnellula suecica TaxID=602035 RepID=A0A8T9C4Y2_9HELO|nr:hypothetical protein LSUE1_G008361 [Lachnellula suecica]
MPPIREPTIFESPGTEPDVRIVVFDREFHVHSAILRHDSGFFRENLVSSNASGTTASHICYEYVSVVDDEGAWRLEQGKEMSTTEAKELKNGLSKPAEEAAFEKLLCAMYDTPYPVKSLQELSDISRLAHLYQTISIVSLSLNSAKYSSPRFPREINLNPLEALILARELRQPFLFREALVYAVSRWADCRFDRKVLDAHPDLKTIVESEYSKISMQIAIVLYITFASVSRKDRIFLFVTDELKSSVSLDPGLPPTRGAKYFRALYERLASWDQDSCSSVKEILQELLKINITLVDHNYTVAESDKFLCAQIEDGELPWDLAMDDRSSD